VLSSPLRKRTLAAGVRTGRHQPVGTNVVCRGRSAFTVVQASLALTAAFDASAVGDLIELVFARESRPDAINFRPPSLHIQLSPLNRFTLFVPSRGGDYASVSTVAALEDAYTDADLFETIKANGIVLALSN
jgi:hypothetical protein